MPINFVNTSIIFVFTFPYQLADILKHVQDCLRGYNEDNLWNAGPLHFRACISFASSLSYNLVNQQMGKKELFAAAFLVCGILRDDFETIPFCVE